MCLTSNAEVIGLQDCIDDAMVLKHKKERNIRLHDDVYFRSVLAHV